MPQLLIAALLLWGFVAGTRWLARADPKSAVKRAKQGAGLAALAAGVLVLLLRGDVEAAAVAGALGFWLLGFAAGPPSFFRNLGYPQRSEPGATVLRTSLIEWTLEPRLNRLDGRVLAGEFAGRAFESMSQAECFALRGACVFADPRAVRLLDLYLDRRFPAWRAAGDRDEDLGRRQGLSSSEMTEDEAYEMLGLAKGSPREEIARAHRTLMKKVHPDHGGTTSLAALLNEAKDTLMRRHR